MWCHHLDVAFLICKQTHLFTMFSLDDLSRNKCMFAEMTTNKVTSCVLYAG